MILAFLRGHAKRITALGLIVVLYGFTRLPEASDAERVALATDFRFTRLALPTLALSSERSIRAVNPSLAHIATWISSVGAAVGLADLDDDGLPNDVCYVDPRTDLVIVVPAPSTPPRYAPFALTPDPFPLDPTTAPMGCLPGDVNEDGLMDVVVYYWGRTPIAFLRLPGEGRALSSASYVRQQIVPGGGRWFTNAVTFTDVDGDGHVDLIVGNYFPDGSRILDARATVSDQMQHSMSRAYNGGALRFLHWKAARGGRQPAVRFEEARVDLGVAGRGWALAIGAADLDGDLLPEIYVANDFGPDRLLHNRSTPGVLRFTPLEGRKTLTTPNSKVLGRDSFKGMGVEFGDVNGDGLLDIYVSNIATEFGLQESHFVFISTGEVTRMREGVAPYVDRSEALGLSRSGWAWDAKLADFNNDGVLEAVQAKGFVKGVVNRWPELHELATGNDELLSRPGSWPRFALGDDLSGHEPNSFFVRGRRGRYLDLARDLGLGDPQVSRGIAIADVDGDGRLDFAIANQWNTSYLYRNESRAAAFLGLHLLLPIGTASGASRIRPGHPGPDTLGRPAIGAAATVHLPDGRRLVAQVDGGNGHSGKRSPSLHFGLGHVISDLSLRVELKWRDSGGRVRQETLTLRPGWHTVVLADEGSRS